jgi:hypothetical protein
VVVETKAQEILLVPMDLIQVLVQLHQQEGEKVVCKNLAVQEKMEVMEDLVVVQDTVQQVEVVEILLP